MLTARGWWFLFLVLVQIALGMIVSSHFGPLVAVIGFILLAWFAVEWALFQCRVHFGLPRVKIRRQLRAGRRHVPIVWAGQDFEVVIDIVLNSRVRLPYITMQDRPPSRCERVSGRDDGAFSLTSEDVHSITYSLRCDVPGEIRFEGVRIQVADIQGFFYHRSFRRQPATFLVLPPLADAEGNRRTTKAHNVLPPPGLHRLRQAGGGGELHDLRDYRPGDPPKMIAWKISARRDRLITKEFESDVPVRCTLFVDTSPSVRIGPPRETMLNQITTIASGTAQAALSDRDHVGLVLFDEAHTEILPPARNARHLIDLLHRLARANNAAPISPRGDLTALLPLAVPLAHEIYPDLMDRRINRTPFRMFWQPLLDSRTAWIALIPMLPLLLLFGWGAAVICCFLFNFGEELRNLRDAGAAATDFFGSILWPVAAAAGLGLFGGLFWAIHGLSGQFPPWHTQRMRRKRIAALMAVLDDAPVGTEARYLDDDDACAERLQRFLAGHHRRYPVTLFDEHGHYLFRAEGKIDVLSRSLVHAVTHGRDNELFVILADLFELQDHLEPLLRATRVARARHHQVLVICPWLPGIPVLDDNLSPEARSKTIRTLALAAGFRGIEGQLFRQTVQKYHASFQALRHELGRSGVLLARAQQHESVRLILNRMDRLRGVRARR